MSNNLNDRITEFFHLQGHGIDSYYLDDDAEDSFCSDLSFGTAGLRAVMGAGFNRMNEVTVGIASMGIAAYLKDKFGGGTGVVIGYDHRHRSKEFALLAAKIYTIYGHSVRIFPKIVPTPFVPSAIQKFHGKFGLGVMITASHNSKEYNGYKVYSSNGAQILDGVAKGISEFIQLERGKFKKIQEECNNFQIEADFELFSDVKDWYIEKLKIFISSLTDRETPVKVVYTALHGVGSEYVNEIFSTIFPASSLVNVEAQELPDPNFPTVKYPNPEEGESTLKLAFEKADSEGVNVIFANDPDADRFCVAERDSRSGKWRIFNGNEIATLLANFISRENSDNEKVAMLSSCVSSKFLEVFCSKRGWRHERTQTGFKNLGNEGIKLKDEEGYKILFSYEEAIGFQVGDWNFDKDGITALITFYSLLTYAKASTSISELLKGIYLKESCWPVQFNGYFSSSSVKKIKEILHKLASSTKIDFQIENFGPAWLILRSSGTEPKLKYYSELLITKMDARIEDAAKELQESVMKIINNLIEPEMNNLHHSRS